MQYKYSTELMTRHKKYSTELGKKEKKTKKTPHVAKVILHRAYAENRKETLIKEYRKKTKSGKKKNPIEVERTKTQPNKKKKIVR